MQPPPLFPTVPSTHVRGEQPRVRGKLGSCSPHSQTLQPGNGENAREAPGGRGAEGSPPGTEAGCHYLPSPVPLAHRHHSPRAPGPAGFQLAVKAVPEPQTEEKWGLGLSPAPHLRRPLDSSDPSPHSSRGAAPPLGSGDPFPPALRPDWTQHRARPGHCPQSWRPHAGAAQPGRKPDAAQSQFLLRRLFGSHTRSF